MIKRSSQNSIDSVSLAIWAVGTLLGKTWRSRVITSEFSNPSVENGTARIFCFWHSHLLPVAFSFRGTGKTAVVSQSRDGKRAAAVAKMWKTDIIFGSSSHGGVSALRQCLRTLSSNKSIAITPDGPRGPREKVKPGISQLALLSKAPVITISALPSKAWYLNSWDRFMIPKPFTKMDIVVSKPISYPEKSMEELSNIIEERLCTNAKMA
ncbi:MAG TPA: lysophospholipid acyltransferase family protein [Chitinispirillaceae bacterium]|nr:lysophospholipid acyltransferase family protein [Chitinispirillaceae bacterium]